MNAAVTGIGLVTPLGATAPETWRRLLAGHYVTDHSRAAGDWDNPSPDSRATQMALHAAREAITQAAWTTHDLDTTETAIVVGTSKGSIERWISPALHMASEPYITGGLLNPSALADVASALALELHLPQSPKLTISAACASGLIALIRAALLIQSNQCRRALVVATEASLHPLFLGSFARLGVLAKQGAGCRPFDQHRDGFLMTEAAAALCLEARPPGSGIFIDRVALGADASHLTAADPNGLVLRHLLTRLIPNDRIDLIHAHGTGTQTNDPIELAAIESTLPSRSPHAGLGALSLSMGDDPDPAPKLQTQNSYLYSHKAALGHSLGAAGLIAVTLNCLAHQHQTIPANIRTTNPLPTTKLTLSPTPVHRPIYRSIALAAGFGGATAAVSLTST
jgi:3-oxoacyl-[acyl-carrier-protein] synthase II